MPANVFKILVVTCLAIALAVAVTKLIPWIILGVGVYVVYRFLKGKTPQG